MNELARQPLLLPLLLLLLTKTFVRATTD